jgi:hypothetical protein
MKLAAEGATLVQLQLDSALRQRQPQRLQDARALSDPAAGGAVPHNTIIAGRGAPLAQLAGRLKQPKQHRASSTVSAAPALRGPVEAAA